jgi:hypothetical protein
MNVRVSDIAFDVNFVDVHSETKPLGCTLLERLKTTSSDWGMVESIRVRVGFSIPRAHGPKLRRDRHKYIFGVTGPELDSAVTAFCGSPGQNTIELSGCASHLRGGRGLVDRYVLSPSNPRRTSHRSTLDAWTQLSQSAYSARWK